MKVVKNPADEESLARVTGAALKRIGSRR